MMKKIHRAWLVLFMCTCMFGATMGLYNNCTGLYTAFMLSEMGWAYTTYTIVTFTTVFSMALVNRFADRLFKKYLLKLVLLTGVIIIMGMTSAQALINGLPAFIFISIMLGVGGAFVFFIPIPMLINNWFAKKRDTAMGISMLSSGLFAAVFSPIFNHFISLYGWRTAVALNGLIGLIIAVPPILLFAVKKPEELGLKPLGYEEPKPMKVYTSPSQAFENGNPDYLTEISPSEKKRLFIYSVILSVAIYEVSYTPLKLPHFATVSGIGASVGAVMLSLAQAGNVVTKFLIGRSSDKYGPKKAYTAALMVCVLVIAVLVCMPRNTAVLYAVSFGAGTICAASVLTYPAMVRTFSKGDEYTTYIAKTSTYMMAFSVPFTLLKSRLFDVTGSYFTTFILDFVLISIALIMCILIFRRQKSDL